MKGKLPITERIILESNESQWNLCARGLVNELKITGIVEKEKNLKVRIKLVINKVFSPDMVSGRNMLTMRTNLADEHSESLTRSFLFLHDFLEKTVWLFFGYIDGDEKIPVMILHVQSIDITIYTQKLKHEASKVFFPPFPQAN